VGGDGCAGAGHAGYEGVGGEVGWELGGWLVWVLVVGVVLCWRRWVWFGVSGCEM